MEFGGRQRQGWEGHSADLLRVGNTYFSWAPPTWSLFSFSIFFLFLFSFSLSHLLLSVFGNTTRSRQTQLRTQLWLPGLRDLWVPANELLFPSTTLGFSDLPSLSPAAPPLPRPQPVVGLGLRLLLSLCVGSWGLLAAPRSRAGASGIPCSLRLLDHLF